VATPSTTERLAGGVLRLMAPKIGPKPAAAMPSPHSTLPSVSMTPSVAIAMVNMPMTYSRPPPATVRAVPKRSEEVELSDFVTNIVESVFSAHTGAVAGAGARKVRIQRLSEGLHPRVARHHGS